MHPDDDAYAYGYSDRPRTRRAIDNPCGATQQGLADMAEASPWEQVEAFYYQVRRPVDAVRHREAYREDRQHTLMVRRAQEAAKREDAAPECACGCGEAVKCSQNGVWSKWRPGHQMRG